MNPTLLPLLACPRCRHALDLQGEALRCAACDVRFGVTGGIPRLADGAVARDARIAAEFEAQHHALPLYVDAGSVVNRVEVLLLPRVLDLLAGAAGPVLDLGCGVGHLGRAWAERDRSGRDLVGVDLMGVLLDQATSGYAALVEGDGHRLPFGDATFGAVALTNALHHLAEPEQTLAEVARVVRPGGVVVSYDPRELAPLEWIKKVVRRHDHAFGDHHRAFSVADYRALYARPGLTLERLQAVDPLGPLVATALDLVSAGKLGITDLAARTLVAVDAAITLGERVPGLGLMLVARARRS